ncbi:MAG: S41 family peptidase [Hyphomonas sp.]|uniref:S41 family peptidase n=1 Tax=Hyphomonas sp. TaxID=87 RepID=UPI003528AA58
MNRRDFIGAALMAAASAAAAPFALAGGLTDAEAREDMRILRGALDLHPGLFRYNTPDEMAGRLSALEQAYVAADGLASRFLILSEFLAAVRCGHTHCNPYNQSDEVVASLFDRRTRVPFPFTWIDGEMVVLPNAGDLPAGSTITRLNGQCPKALLRALLPYARTDGHNAGKQVALMTMQNSDTFETFDIFQGLIAPPAGGEHRVQARYPDGRELALDLPALDLTERRAQQITEEKDGTSDPLWTWEVRDDIAILTMPTWVMYNSRWDWKAWLDERLASLGGLKGLVLDLRLNEGGNECGNVILSRLASTDLQFPGYQQRVRFRQTPAELDPYLDTWDRSFRTLGQAARDMGDGFLVLPSEMEATDLIPATEPKITVPVAALVGPACSSATFSFARRAQEAGLVRLFGEQTGGNLRGINGSAYFFVRLPGSGLEFDVPLIGFFPLVERPDRGIPPDVEVRQTESDIADGFDRCMETAIAWCRG